MPQLQSRDAPGSVVTVADLVRRHSPEPPPHDDDDLGEPGGGTGATISVDALLRREGWSSPDDDRPFVIGGWTSPTRSVLVRRGAIVAGALLAAGTVVGLTAVLNTTSFHPVANGSYTDDGGALDPASDAATADPAAVSTDVATASTAETTVPPSTPATVRGAQIAQHAIAPATSAPARPVAPAAPQATTAASDAKPGNGAENGVGDDDPHGGSTPTKHHGSTPRTTPPPTTANDHDPTTTRSPSPSTSARPTTPPPTVTPTATPTGVPATLRATATTAPASPVLASPVVH